MKYAVIILSLLVSAASAQTFQQPQSQEQLYRQINAALAQENARLGNEIAQLQQQINQLATELAKAKAKQDK